jgi:hypothetical protein
MHSRKTTVLAVALGLTLGCGGSGSDAKAPTGPENPIEPTPANVIVASASAGPTTITAHLKNTGGPGVYKIEMWGIPHEPNGPDFFFGETEPVEVNAGYDETVTWVMSGRVTGPIGWLLVFTRDQGSALYRQSARFDFPDP